MLVSGRRAGSRRALGAHWGSSVQTGGTGSIRLRAEQAPHPYMDLLRGEHTGRERRLAHARDVEQGRVVAEFVEAAGLGGGDGPFQSRLEPGDDAPLRSARPMTPRRTAAA